MNRRNVTRRKVVTKKQHPGLSAAEKKTHRYQGIRELLDMVMREEALLLNEKDDFWRQYLIIAHTDKKAPLIETLCEHRNDSDIITHYFKEFSAAENLLLPKVDPTSMHANSTTTCTTSSRKSWRLWESDVNFNAQARPW